MYHKTTGKSSAQPVSLCDAKRRIDKTRKCRSDHGERDGVPRLGTGPLGQSLVAAVDGLLPPSFILLHSSFILLLPSALTGFCLTEFMLKKLGVGQCSESASASPAK
jgi:hypothetical protein